MLTIIGRTLFRLNSYIPLIYKRNYFSTDKYNKLMEQTAQLVQPMQNLKIQQAKIQETKDIPLVKELTKKEKKADKIKGEVKEKKEVPEKDEGPKLFSQVDLRIGEIVQCWKHPESQNLYCQKIIVNDGQVRQIASGLQKYIPIEDVKGKVLVMANLRARNLGGFASNGMVVCALTPDESKIELLVPEGQNGERIYLEGYEDLFKQGEILPVMNSKKKILQRVLQHFRTDAEGYVVWSGIKLRTKAGYIKAPTIYNGNVS